LRNAAACWVTCSSKNGPDGRFILFQRRNASQANPVFSPLVAGGALYALSQLPEAVVRAAPVAHFRATSPRCAWADACLSRRWTGAYWGWRVR
jgi:hypothetical protein